MFICILLPIKRLLTLCLALGLVGCTLRTSGPTVNPDPNHTHADFAIWINGEQLDFSAPELMSGLSTDEPKGEHDDTDRRHPYLHLHDGIGHVIHRHKTGLTLQDFFASLQVGFDATCYTSFAPMADGQICSENGWFRLFVNGEEKKPFDVQYVFADLDRILITDAPDGPALQAQLQKLTDDACLYSRTCSDRGEAPTEGCVADPTIPCVEEL